MPEAQGGRMNPKFITAIHYEGRILMIAETGDVYELDMHGRSVPTWSLLAYSPWPDNSREPA